MTIDEKRKYLRIIRDRYWASDRPGKSEMLDEAEKVTGLHRRSVVRLLRGPTLARKPRTKGRRAKYGSDVQAVVWVVWESLDWICAERITPCLADMARHLAKFGEVALTRDVEQKLETISVSTVQRMMSRMKSERPRLPRKGPERANGVRRAVPMLRLPWNLTEPGYFEADLVHHSGATTSGDYVHTLQLIDIATGWSERAALLGRSQKAMETAFCLIHRRLPFAIVHLHPDNGSEFFSRNLITFLTAEYPWIELSRSRPYHKNDNRFVEQKNDTLVRQYFQNARLDTRPQVGRLNTLYDRMWLYYNFFQPVLRLSHKEIVDGKLRRKWDRAATPYQRLVATDVLDDTTRRRLDRLVENTNPRKLHREIEESINRLFTIPSPVLTTAQRKRQTRPHSREEVADLPSA
jgi:hypothetical protein